MKRPMAIRNRNAVSQRNQRSFIQPENRTFCLGARPLLPVRRARS
jgi:hypothetical protein